MSIGFENLDDHVIPMAEFLLKYRFTDPDYEELPQSHLAQLKPLDTHGSKFLWNYIKEANIHLDFPFKRDLFNVIDKFMITGDDEQETKKWLYKRGFPFDKPVYLSWQPDLAMIIPWELLIKYFDAFYYSIADDLTVIDQNLNWALLFFHEHEIYFGSNEKYTPHEVSEDTSFL
ncbi:hypothetical protein [Mucilaginibacter ginsenosidivorans]|uniref:Uncharacterized protein n=1 Tax=Mucilaginibacter ginsenosidivorans TaxID=398053 RepID=A0A5B8V3L5_9SPHI|nr:hypothetical protein [Mucilaginibacter ginsenosidivorans]QEC65291.1 hypothetical protein FRZ54_22870 [Mucilaginibacter ginsenosidivorans]